MSLPIFNDRGIKRVLACLPTPAETRKLFRAFPPQKLIPRSQWVDVDLRQRGLKFKVLDQAQTSGCVGHGAVTAFSYAWQASGGFWREFSACWIYGLINGGRDQGANVGDALTVLTQTGVCLESEVPEGMIYSSQFPQTAVATAKRFRIGDAENCPTFDDIGTAIQLGRPVCFGIDVYTNFEPDANGVIPPPAGRIQGGHCMCAMGMKILGGRPYGLVQNSWTTGWGLAGFCFLGEEHFAQDSTDNWALPVGGAIEDPRDPSAPPEPK